MQYLAEVVSGLKQIALMVAVALILAGAQPAAAEPVYAEVSDVDALVAAVAQVGPGGGLIVLRPGNYVIEEPLKLKSVNSLEIRGSGWSTTLRTQGTIDAIVFENCAFCVVRDLLICADQSTDTGSGIVFRDQCSSNTVDFVRVHGFGESGIWFDGVADRPQSSNTVSRCHLIDNAKPQLLSRCNNDFFMVQNQFGVFQRLYEKAPDCGVLLDHSSAGTYTANYHWGNRVAFRMTGGSHFNRIENNRFENSQEQGVVMGGPEEEPLALNIFTGNTVHTNSESGSGKFAAVEAYNAHDIIFSGNQIFSWNSDAIRHQHSLWLHPNCVNWIVTDNTLRHNTEAAIRCDDRTPHVFRDNRGDEN